MMKGDVKIIHMDDGMIEFLVRSSRDGYHFTKYNKVLNAWSCTCEWYGYRGGYCRHMRLAKVLLDGINGMVQGCDDTVKRLE